MSLEELIKACAENNDPAAWEEFIRRFRPLIAAIVKRMTERWSSNSPALVDDLIQDTFLKICSDRKRLLAEFTPHHPEAFYGYLKVITANVVHDYFRAQRSQKRGLGQPECSIDDEAVFARPMGTTVGADNVHLNILLREVDDILNSVLAGSEKTRDRTIFWLYYYHGFTASEIARLPSIGLMVKGVESVIHRLTRMVRERLADGDSAVG